MRLSRAVVLAGSLLLLGTLVLEGQTRVRRGGLTAPPAPGEGIPVQPSPPPPGGMREPGVQSGPSEPTRFQVEFFQVSCPVANLMRIDVDQLTEGSPSAEEFVKRLSEVGEASMPVRVNNVIDLRAASHLTEGSSIPTVQDINISSNGKVTPSITYKDVGASIQVQGAWEGQGPHDTARVHCRIELSSIGQAGIKIASGVQLPEFHQFKIDQQLVLNSGKPALLLSNSQTAPSSMPADASTAATPAPRCTATLVRITAWRLATGTEPAP